MIKDGVKAIKYFSSKGIRTNCTLVFTAGQALLAAKAGATYVSPFIGRLDDISFDGLDLIQQIVQFNILKEGIEKKDLLSQLKKSSSISLAANQLYKLTTSKDPIFFQGSKDIYEIFTKENEFLLGSTLNHLSNRYNETADLLSVYNSMPGMDVEQTINQKVSKGWKYGIIGSITLDILKTIGWNTFDDIQSKTFIKVSNDEIDDFPMKKGSKSMKNGSKSLKIKFNLCNLLLLNNPGLNLMFCN
jgi:hypothetical protein